MTDEPPRWVLVSRTFIAAYGTFATEQGCWDFVWARRKPRPATTTRRL